MTLNIQLKYIRQAVSKLVFCEILCNLNFASTNIAMFITSLPPEKPYPHHNKHWFYYIPTSCCFAVLIFMYVHRIMLSTESAIIIPDPFLSRTGVTEHTTDLFSKTLHINNANTI